MTPVLLIGLWPSAPLVGVVLLAISHLLIVYATLRPNVQWLGPVITTFDTDRKELWLTIDDGPTPDTESILDLFDRFGVKATFFVKGTLAERDAELVRMMIARGHSVANHSHTHPSATFWCLPPTRIAKEIDRCNDILTHLTGERPRWFRAPVGMKNPGVHPVLARRKMRLIGWSIRAFDGVRAEPERVLARVASHFRAGAILVMHQGLPNSAETLERVVREAQQHGYAFVIPEDGQLRA